MAVRNVFQYYDGVFRWIFLKQTDLIHRARHRTAPTSSKLLKYGLHAERTILWALHVCPSQAKVTSVKLFSSRKCRNDDTMLLWKSFHFRKNCCWSAIFERFQSATGLTVYKITILHNLILGSILRGSRRGRGRRSGHVTGGGSPPLTFFSGWNLDWSLKNDKS
jgi:hypothetical protein